MINRKILYGYRIENRSIAVNKNEADVVNMVFEQYLSGSSYQKLSELLNNMLIPYSPDSPTWNKHKVKRMLENPRYCGGDAYPEIVMTATYSRVQRNIQNKQSSYSKKPKRPAKMFSEYLRCGKCHSALSCCGGGTKTLFYRCNSCKESYMIADEMLLCAVSSQAIEHDQKKCYGYIPSVDVLKNENAINRKLESQGDIEEIVELILHGISARYDCCSIQENTLDTDKLDWNNILKSVSHIIVNDENTATVIFQGNG
jgi:hypothetical protein